MSEFNFMELLEVGVAYTVFFGFLIGFLINFTGVGGGVLLVPVLNLVFGMEVSIAVGTASLFVTLTKIYATFEHIKLKTIHYKVSWFFLYGAIPGVLMVSGLINYLLTHMEATEIVGMQASLKQIVVGAIFFSTFLIVLQKLPFFKKLKSSNVSGSKEKYILIMFGMLIGMVMGATGVGGGVLIFPTFFLFTRLSSKEIVGSSIFIALVLSTITAVIYSGGGQTDYRTAILLVIGSLGGVYVAGKAIKKISTHLLDYVIIGLIFFSGIVMLITK